MKAVAAVTASIARAAVAHEGFGNAAFPPHPPLLLVALECHFYSILCAMKSSMDAAGRILVPKAVRDALGLKLGQSLEIRAVDGRLEVEIASTPMQLKKRGKGLVSVPGTKLPSLTAEQVRDTLERLRR